MKTLPFTLLRPVFFGILLWGSPVLHADDSTVVVAQYEFPLGGSALLSSDQHLTSTASNFSYGIAPVNVNLNDGWINTHAGITSNSETGAAASTAYFSFTVTPDGDTSLSLSRLTFGSAFYYPDGSNDYQVSIFVRSSIDNYATTIGSVFAEQGQSNVSTPVFTPRTLDLTDPAFQNLTAPVTFRFYMYDNLNGGTRYYGFNDVVLEASIPEPSTWAFLLSTGTVLFCLSRFQRTLCA